MKKYLSEFLPFLICIAVFSCKTSTEPTDPTDPIIPSVKELINTIEYFPISENKTMKGILHGKLEEFDEGGNLIYTLVKPETVYEFKFGAEGYYKSRHGFPFIDITDGQNNTAGYFSQSGGETFVTTSELNDKWVTFLPLEVEYKKDWIPNPSYPQKEQVNCVYDEYFASYTNGVNSYTDVMKINVSYYDSSKVSESEYVSEDIVVKVNIDFLFAKNVGVIQVKLNYYSRKRDVFYISYNEHNFEHFVLSGMINF